MLFSSSVNEVARAYIKARKSITSLGKAKKGQVGTQSYKYIPLDEILNKVNSALEPVQCAVILELLGNYDFNHQANYSWQAAKGEKTAIYSTSKLGVKVTILHESGEYMSSDVFWFNCTVDLAQASPSAPQQIGIQVTYMKRYALTGFLGLSLEEDNDGVVAIGTTGNKTTTATVQVERFWADNTKLADPKFFAIYDAYVKEVGAKPTFEELKEFHTKRNAK